MAADRKRLPRPTPARTLTSTEAKNNFGQLLTRAQRDGYVFISRHDQPEAVVISMPEYEKLASGGDEDVDLSALERRFDELVERMQQPAQRRAVAKLFGMSGAELGAAAQRTRKRK